MSTQSVYKNGNSLAVTVPKEHLGELGLESGSLVSWKKTKKGLLLVPQDKSKSPLTPEFKRWLDEVQKKHSDLIRELAKK